MKRADEGMGFLLRYENVAWYEDGAVRILDRRIYPVKTEYVICTKHEEVAKAIGDMVTQSGGPYTGGGHGNGLSSPRSQGTGWGRVDQLYGKGRLYPVPCKTHHGGQNGPYSRTEPWTWQKSWQGKDETERKSTEPLREYAFNYINNNYLKYEKVGKYLADLIPQNGTIMTQCFAETIIGTLIRECHRRNNDIKMICAETRPYSRGRLTASVAYDMG